MKQMTRDWSLEDQPEAFLMLEFRLSHLLRVRKEQSHIRPPMLYLKWLLYQAVEVPGASSWDLRILVGSQHRSPPALICRSGLRGMVTSSLVMRHSCLLTTVEELILYEANYPSPSLLTGS
nr:uncharacterized protein LOC110568080 [Aotus nancymaae]XP_021525697.1 uncharacterized protein LOC110568080 [Aotus nancymaae]XP_021525698.1 uncharacterized protein LOC110568080 [Aotus nancymaae]